MTPRLRRLWCGSLPVLLSAISAGAQCQLDWQPGPPAPGPAGAVRALAVAANGDLIAGGTFAVAGGSLARNIARFDGSQWLPYGAGIDGPVEAVVLLPNGQLIAAGTFDFAGNAPTRNIARWNGVDWFPLGLGLDGPVRDLALLQNGSLVAVGAFQTAGGIAAPRAAVWNGFSWSALGGGPNTDVRSVTVLPNGDVVVGGDSFPLVPDVERFDGTNWVPLNGVATNQITLVSSVQALPNGDIVIAGGILGGAAPLGLWDGSQLIPLTPPLDFIADLGVAQNGELLVVGRDTTQPLSAPLARFDGATWTLVGSAVEFGYQRLAVGANGSTYLARAVLSAQTLGLSNVASLQSGTWVPLPIAPIAVVHALAALPNGDIAVGGAFQSIGGVAAANVARFTGTGFAPLALGVDGPVSALAVAPDGSLLVGGSFQNAGGSPAASVARWNGTSWNTLGAGLGISPRVLVAGDGGRVLAISSNVAAVFDGQAWTTVPLPSGLARDALAMPNGDFLIAGVFVLLGPTTLAGVLRVSGGVATVEAAVTSTNTGSLVRGADGAIFITSVGPVLQLLRYDGTTTQFIATTPAGIIDLNLMPNGDLVGVTGLNSAEGAVLRFDGTAWSQVLPSLRGGITLDLTVGARGDIFAAGTFHSAGDQASYLLAHATTSCPAALVAVGAGCVGSSGPVSLNASGLPWLGSEFEQVATGFPSPSVAVHAIGVSSNVLPLPLGAPGCNLVVDPVMLELLLPQGGAVAAPLSIPNAPVLVGQNLFTQIVGIELDANLSIVQTTASNGLRLTVGVF